MNRSLNSPSNLFAVPRLLSYYLGEFLTFSAPISPSPLPMSPRYVVKGKIGAGGLGEVYLATDTQLDRDVALKRVKPPESGSVDGLHADLIREARTLSSLQHPHIVTIYDVGQDELGPFVVMELLKGETLDQVIDRGALTVEDFKEVVVQSLEGMIAAQEMGLVHRDLKPGNLMVIWLASGKFQIKILDFGLAKFSRTATRQTEDQESGIMGSIFFMAPEQFERLPLDARTDMYSLGCIFYQILTTKYPFDGKTGPEVMVSHLQHHVQHLVEARPDLPVWLADWVMWLISRDMEDRPGDARTSLEFFRAEKSGIKNPTPARITTRVKIVGRGTGPGGVTQQVGGRATQPVKGQTQRLPGSASQALQGTTAVSRSSRPAARKVPRKSRTGWWILLAMLAAGGAAAGWFLTHPKTPSADPRAGMEALLSGPPPAPDPTILTTLLTALKSDGPDAPRAAELLKKMKGAPIAAALASELEKATGGARLLLMDAMTSHPSKAGTAQFLRISGDDTGPIRSAALEAVAKAGSLSDVPELFRILPKIKDNAGREALFRTVASLLGNDRDATSRTRLLSDALRSADAAARPEVLRLLGQTGHPNANRTLAGELAAAGDRRRDALAALKDWPAPDNTVTEALLGAAASPTDREAAIMAFCHALPLISSANGAELVAALRRAQPLVTSVKNREAFCTALAGTAATEATDYAKALSADPDWTAPAGKAAAALALLTANLTALGPGEVHLDASKAAILAVEKDAYYTSTSRYVTNWKNPASRIAWDITLAAPATVDVKILQSSSLRTDRTFRVRLGTGSEEAKVQPTESNESFLAVDTGKFQVPRAGTWRLWVDPVRMEPGQPLFNVREAVLTVK